mgnify:CR=1 FL=1
MKIPLRHILAEQALKGGVRRDFTGKVSGNTMEGTMKLETGPESRWTATKR